MTPATPLIVVTKDQEHVDIVRAVLHADLPVGARFFAGQGRISPASLARNILVHEGGPVLIVMDAETNSPSLSEERRALTLVAVSGVTTGAYSAKGMCEVFAFIPEMEAIFFESPAALEQALGASLPPNIVEEGRHSPKKTLAGLVTGASIPDIKALIARLDEPALRLLAASPQMVALQEKVRVLAHAGVAQVT